MKAQRVSRSITLFFLESRRYRGEWWTPRPGYCTPSTGKTQYPSYRKLGGPQDRPARSESLYDLSYPGPPQLYMYISLYMLQAYITAGWILPYEQFAPNTYKGLQHIHWRRISLMLNTDMCIVAGRRNTENW